MRDTGQYWGLYRGLYLLPPGPPGVRQWWRGAAVAVTAFAVLGMQSARAGIYLSDDGPDEPVARTGATEFPATDAGANDRWDIEVTGSPSPDPSAAGSAGDDRIYLSDGFSVLDVKAVDPSLDRHGQDVSWRVRLGISGYDTMAAAPGEGDLYEDPEARRSQVNDRSLRDVLALYINVIGAQGSADRNGDQAGQFVTIGDQPARRSDDDRSLVGTILRGPVDDGLASAIAFLARPRINESGIVSFSIAGMGDFAIVADDSDGAVAIVDLVTGKLLALPGAGRKNQPRTMADYGWRPDDPARENGRSPGPDRASRIILAILGYAFGLLTDPLTVGAALSGVILWALWHARRKRTIFRRRRHA